MQRTILGIVVSFLFLCAPASAQVTPTGPFSGQLHENFENQPGHSGFQPCVVGRVFSNNGDLCTPSASGCNITSGWGFQCGLAPHSTSHLFGSAQGYAEYSFDSPAQRFGGYFANNSFDPSGGTAVFWDANNNQLASLAINAPNNCQWNWNGWDAGSGPLIKRVSIYGPPQYGGPFMMMDDMELDTSGPPPGTDVCQPGQLGVIGCPCSNPPSGSPAGCDNSEFTGGATLGSSGSASLANDTVVFGTSGQTSVGTSVVLQGDALIPAGVTFGMGVRCAGGNLLRLYVKPAVGGSISAPGIGDASVSASSAALGDPIAAGTQRWYAVYYRDPVVLGGCPSTDTFNSTQTQEILWNP
jgi:hypothetical protein